MPQQDSHLTPVPTYSLLEEVPLSRSCEEEPLGEETPKLRNQGRQDNGTGRRHQGEGSIIW